MKVIKEEKTDQAWTKATNEFRYKNVFSFLYLSISGNEFIKTKKLFGNVRVQQQLNLVRYAEFDSGWTYQNYWGNEYKTWKHVKMMI